MKALSKAADELARELCYGDESKRRTFAPKSGDGDFKSFVAARILAFGQQARTEVFEQAAGAMCEQCKEHWPVRRIEGDRSYWWHDIGNLSRECYAAPIREIQAATINAELQAACGEVER